MVDTLGYTLECKLVSLVSWHSTAARILAHIESVQFIGLFEVYTPDEQQKRYICIYLHVICQKNSSGSVPGAQSTASFPTRLIIIFIWCSRCKSAPGLRGPNENQPPLLCLHTSTHTATVGRRRSRMPAHLSLRSRLLCLRITYANAHKPPRSAQ